MAVGISKDGKKPNASKHTSLSNLHDSWLDISCFFSPVCNSQQLILLQANVLLESCAENVTCDIYSFSLT